MKRNTVFYKIFLPFFLLGILLVGGFSLFIYQNTYESVRENLVKDRKKSIYQMKNNLEQKVRIIEYAFYTYSATSRFEEIFQQPLSEKNFDIYREINRELNFIEILGMEGGKYSLISLDGNWGVIQGSLTQLSEQATQDYRDHFLKSTANLYWKKADAGIEMIITLPMYQVERYAMGIAYISNRSINEIFGANTGDKVSIFNREELIYSSDSAKSIDLSNVDLEKLTFSEPYVAKNQEYILLKSDYNHWIYAIQINETSVSETISSLRISLIVVSITLIGFIGIFAYIFSVRFSQPISRIQKSLNLQTLKFKESELALVEQSIDAIVGENEHLSASLLSQRPQLETLFVLSLFRNRVGKREVEQRLAQFGYDFANKQYYAGVLQIDSLGRFHGGENDLLLLAINNIVAEIVPERDRMIPIVLNDTMQATIFVMEKLEEDSSRKVLNYYEEIQKAVKKYLKISISVGISTNYFSIRESKKAVNFAKEALYYQVNTGPESIIFYEEIAPASGETAMLKYPTELQNDLFVAIRSGEETISVYVDALVDEIIRLNPNPVTQSVTFIRLITEIIQLGQLLGVYGGLFNNVKQLYLRVLTNYRPEEIKSVLLYQLVLPITKSTQTRTDREFKTLSDKIVHIVQTEYDQELSLEIIADRLHYNPNYLSSVFKKESGEKFGDFVQNYRLEIAKGWLKDTEMTVKEIAERLQYRNPQNFIRFFKKKLNLTPGEYRKQFR